MRVTSATAIGLMILFLVTAPSQPQGSPAGAKTLVIEPARSFALIDKNLTTVEEHQRALSEGDVCARSKAARSMKRALGAIERRSARLELLYERRHEPFGTKMFRTLRLRAQAVDKTLDSNSRTRGTTVTSGIASALNSRIVSLVTQFQAASGGFSALRCEPGQFTCCSPKRKEDLRPEQALACRWMCVQAARACRGFRGPRVALR